MICCSALVKCFTTPELMRWPGIEQIYGPHLKKTSVFSSNKLWEDLHTRVIEHVGEHVFYSNEIDVEKLHRTSVSFPNTTPASPSPA